MATLIDLKISGIKCDAPGCGWRDDSVPRADYAAWVNRACPGCGGNLLTQADMNAVLRMERIAAFMNRWLGWLGVLGRKRAHRVDLDGSGKPRVTPAA